MSIRTYWPRWSTSATCAPCPSIHSLRLPTPGPSLTPRTPITWVSATSTAAPRATAPTALRSPPGDPHAPAPRRATRLHLHRAAHGSGHHGAHADPGGAGLEHERAA